MYAKLKPPHNTFVNALEWLNVTFLKMDWLESFIQWIFQTLFQLEPNTQLYDVLTFFVFDTMKIFILLIALIFLVSLIQSYFSPERTRDVLKPYQGVRGNTMGALIHGVIPSLVDKGVGIGTVISFMMAVTALSLPSLVLLKKVVKKELLVFFIGYLVVSIILIGYFLNWIQPWILGGS